MQTAIAKFDAIEKIGIDLPADCAIAWDAATFNAYETLGKGSYGSDAYKELSVRCLDQTSYYIENTEVRAYFEQFGI